MPPIWQYQRLSNDDRNSRRTVSDAIEVLCRYAGFNKRDRASIRVRPLQLPSGDLVGLIDVLFVCDEVALGVSLPMAGRFRAWHQGATQPDEIDIIQLNRAEADLAGQVVMADGTVLSAVEVIPTPMAEPSELDWKIIYLTLSVVEGGERCYRSVQDDLPVSQKYALPDVRMLDWSKLPGLKLPPLKVIAIDIAKADPMLDVSDQKIADALRKFGMRVPPARPRRKARRNASVGSR